MICQFMFERAVSLLLLAVADYFVGSCHSQVQYRHPVLHINFLRHRIREEGDQSVFNLVLIC